MSIGSSPTANQGVQRRASGQAAGKDVLSISVAAIDRPHESMAAHCR